jgi:hypothetical protein
MKFIYNKVKVTMRILLAVLTSSVFLLSCDEPVQLDLGQTPSKIVIEGLVTNLAAYQSVRVTRTTDFYSKGKAPAVTNAIVTVTDNFGTVIPFVHNPENKPDSAGIYFPQTPFAGIVGRSYKLKVEVDGKIYEGQDKLLPLAPIDSLTVKLDKDEQEDPKVEGRVFDLLLFFKKPRNETSYYLFKFFRNDSLTYANNNDVYYWDDEFLAENIDGVEFPILYSIGDQAKIEMYSMSRLGYVYYNDLSSVLNNDAGGMFGPIPASPRTNLSNGALGFFQVSSVVIGEKTVQ